MTVSDILKDHGQKDCVIEFRSIISIDSDDVSAFGGMARYVNKMLVSCDGDTYHLSDEVSNYKWFRDDWLVIYR